MKVFSLSNKNQSEYYELDFRDFRKVSYQNLYYIMGHPILTLFSVLVNGLENTNSLHFFPLPIHSQHSPVILWKLFWQLSPLTFTSSYPLDTFQSLWKIHWTLFSFTVISFMHFTILIFSYCWKIAPFCFVIWQFPGSSPNPFDLFFLVSSVNFFLHSPISY